MMSNKVKTQIVWCLFFGVMVAVVIFPEFAHAQSGFESKVNGLTDKLMSVVLPAVSILGLIYAAILAASGDAAAKGRMILVIGASVVGFLAPVIIDWFRSAVGG